MTTEQAAAEAAGKVATAAIEQARATTAIAQLAAAQNATVVNGITELKAGQVAQQAALSRIEVQAATTNGRVTQIELWRAELKGIAQGSGGTGRLLFYILSSGAAAGTILVALLTVSGHIK